MVRRRAGRSVPIAFPVPFPVRCPIRHRGAVPEHRFRPLSLGVPHDVHPRPHRAARATRSWSSRSGSPSSPSGSSTSTCPTPPCGCTRSCCDTAAPPAPGCRRGGCWPNGCDARSTRSTGPCATSRPPASSASSAAGAGGRTSPTATTCAPPTPPRSRGRAAAAQRASRDRIATPDETEGGGRRSAATRTAAATGTPAARGTAAARVAADLRPNRKQETESPPPPTPPPRRPRPRTASDGGGGADDRSKRRGARPVRHHRPRCARRALPNVQEGARSVPDPVGGPVSAGRHPARAAARLAARADPTRPAHPRRGPGDPLTDAGGRGRTVVGPAPTDHRRSSTGSTSPSWRPSSTTSPNTAPPCKPRPGDELAAEHLPVTRATVTARAVQILHRSRQEVA